MKKLTLAVLTIVLLFGASAFAADITIAAPDNGVDLRYALADAAGNVLPAAQQPVTVTWTATSGIVNLIPDPADSKHCRAWRVSPGTVTVTGTDGTFSKTYVIQISYGPPAQAVITGTVF